MSVPYQVQLSNWKLWTVIAVLGTVVIMDDYLLDSLCFLLDLFEIVSELPNEVVNVSLQDTKQSVGVIVRLESLGFFRKREVIRLRQIGIERNISISVLFDILLQKRFRSDFLVVQKVVDVLIWKYLRIVFCFILHDPLQFKEIDFDVQWLAHDGPSATGEESDHVEVWGLDGKNSRFVSIHDRQVFLHDRFEGRVDLLHSDGVHQDLRLTFVFQVHLRRNCAFISRMVRSGRLL